MKPRFLMPSTCFRHAAGSLSSTKKAKSFDLFTIQCRNFFQDTLTRWFPTAHQDIANTCVSYLLYKDFSGGPVRTYQEARERLEKLLFSYAVDY